MREIKVKVHPSKSNLKKEDQLAWKIAEIASDKAKIDKDAVDMVINRIIDNASVAIASLNRKPVISAREMAKGHLRKSGSTLFGINSKMKFDGEYINDTGSAKYYKTATDNDIIIVNSAGNYGFEHAGDPGIWATEVNSNGDLILGGKMVIVGNWDGVGVSGNKAGHGDVPIETIIIEYVEVLDN